MVFVFVFLFVSFSFPFSFFVLVPGRKLSFNQFQISFNRSSVKQRLSVKAPWWSLWGNWKLSSQFRQLVQLTLFNSPVR